MLSSQDSKKRRVIADSDDEEDEEPAAPKSSSSRPKAATAPAPKKAKTSALPKAGTASKSSKTTKISGVFDSLEISSPKAKKQAQLYSFWKKDQAAKEAAPQPVRENKRKAEDDAPAEDKGAVIAKKAKQASPAAEGPREASAAPVEAAAASTSTSTSGVTGDVDANAGVEEAEQDSNKASTPSVNGSDETSGNGDAAASTALTTPADELDKRLGDDVEEELAEMAAEEEV